MGLISEFKTFINRGNVMDLAVGVIIGGAFATITKSLTDDLIMPVVGYISSGWERFPPGSRAIRTAMPI